MLALTAASRGVLRAPLTRSVHRRLARSYASLPSSPSRKITVVPFRQAPEQARERLLVHGLLASGHWGNILVAGAIRLFGSSVETFARELGLGQELVLRDMKAVYYPIWRVDVIADGKATKDGEDYDGWLAVREGYIPGNAFAPLSYLSYAVPPLESDLPTYNPSTHLRQLDGADIVEVPFNVSPLVFLDKVRRTVGKRKMNGIAFDEARWTESMVAAYPIMFPMYIAEFEDNGADGVRRYTVVMDAHEEATNSCRVSFPPPDEMRDSDRLPPNYYVNPAPYLPSANLILTGNPQLLTFPAAGHMAKSYQQWMSPAPSGSIIPASPTYSVAGEAIDWEDPRIMPWGSPAHEENGEYMEKGFEVHREIEAMQAMAAFSDVMPESTMVQIGRLERGHKPKFVKKTMSDAQREMEDKMAQARAEFAALKPEWLRKYDAERGKKEVGEVETEKEIKAEAEPVATEAEPVETGEPKETKSKE